MQGCFKTTWNVVRKQSEDPGQNPVAVNVTPQQPHRLQNQPSNTHARSRLCSTTEESGGTSRNRSMARGSRRGILKGEGKSVTDILSILVGTGTGRKKLQQGWGVREQSHTLNTGGWTLRVNLGTPFKDRVFYSERLVKKGLYQVCKSHPATSMLTAPGGLRQFCH